MIPHNEELLSDKALRDASDDQISHLVHKLNLVLQHRRMGRLRWIHSDDVLSEPGSPANPSAS